MKHILAAYIERIWPPESSRAAERIFNDTFEYMQLRLATLSSHCVVCDTLLPCPGPKPVPCESPTCSFGYDELGLGSGKRCPHAFAFASAQSRLSWWTARWACIICRNGTTCYLGMALAFNVLPQPASDVSLANYMADSWHLSVRSGTARQLETVTTSHLVERALQACSPAMCFSVTVFNCTALHPSPACCRPNSCTSTADHATLNLETGPGFAGIVELYQYPSVADLLISMALAAIQCHTAPRRAKLFATVPATFVVKPGYNGADPELNWDSMRKTLDALPTVDVMAASPDLRTSISKVRLVFQILPAAG